MIVMNILRMLVDVAFYGAFAGLIAANCGGGGAFVGALIQCVCFGLSSAAGKRRLLRLALLLPMGLGWVIHRDSPADCVLLIPTAVYIVALAWKGDYALDHDRQRHLFGVFWKVLLPVVAIVMLAGGTAAVAAVSMPYALTMLVCSVLLLRALRHDPSVYRQKNYQLINVSAVALVVAAARLVSSKTFLRGCAAAGKTVYVHVLRPLLELLLQLLLLVFEGVSKLIALLPFGGGARAQSQEAAELDLNGVENMFGDDFEIKQPGLLLRLLGWGLLIAAAVVLLVVFFRWLNRRRPSAAVSSAAEAGRTPVETDRREKRKRETSPVRKIRAQYRGFLKWCAGLGVETRTDSTSLDVHRRFCCVSDQAETSGQIRELYIQARYADKADQDGVRRMKQLCAEAKKSGTDHL